MPRVARVSRASRDDEEMIALTHAVEAVQMRVSWYEASRARRTRASANQRYLELRRCLSVLTRMLRDRIPPEYRTRRSEK